MFTGVPLYAQPLTYLSFRKTIIKFLTFIWKGECVYMYSMVVLHWLVMIEILEQRII